MYVIKFTDYGLQNVRALSKSVRNALKAELLEKLAADPHRCSVGLTTILRGFRSYHWNDYRIVFKIYDDLQAISIAAVGKHDKNAKIDVYKRLEAVVSQGRLAQKALIALKGFSLPDSG